MPTIIERDVPLPLYLNTLEKLSDEALFALCAANPHLNIERDQNDQLIIMAPVGGETGNKHTDLIIALGNWNNKEKKGKVFDSSTGFLLPDGSMRSPDVAWVGIERWNNLSPKQKERFLPFAPDFLIEVVSPTDHLKTVQRKMQLWIENGSRMGWLIAPKQQLAFVYRSDGGITKIDGFDKTLSGEAVLPDFRFDLSVLL